jgi:phosphoglycolate phosphatase-like HAD superfamily hydrolase
VGDSLVLFDIDGTLTRGAGPHHRAALENAVHRVTGVAGTTQGIPVHGMLDRVILTLMLRAAGFSDEETLNLLPDVMAAAEDLYQTGVPDLRDKLCPGVPEVLKAMEERGVVLALVTGNLTRIGWHKLSRAGIHHHFRFGAFGEMAPTRGALAKMAIERAGREGLIDVATARISLIGDAASDIQAARDAGIQSIAVRTGIAPLEELTTAGPDILLDDLTRLNLAII